MRRLFCIGISLALLFALSCAGIETLQQGNNQTLSQAQQSQSQQSIQNWTGDGGKGMSLTILAPQSTGLNENQSHLPALVQGEFVSNFLNFSAIEILNWERLDEIYDNLLSGFYADDAGAVQDLGNLTPTTHIMGGNITRTATGFAVQMHITRTSDKMTTASYSGTFTFAELDNLTGIRRTSLDLIQKMGVTLTASAQEELAGAAEANHVNAQTALARGVTAQRQGTEVAALSYYFMAASFDPTLTEAASRASILNANIASGNIGMDVRNDIAWRRQWLERLTETEQFFNSFHQTESMPYTLFYSNEITRGRIDYHTETVALSIETHLHGSGIWTLSIERALFVVWGGLNATGRVNDWGFSDWPRRGVTNLNAFSRRSNNFSVVFELLNDQDKVIGRQTLQSGGFWELSWTDRRPIINVQAADRRTLNFQNVSANDITDRMTIKIANINGIDAETAARNGVLQIQAISRNEFNRNDRYRFAKGEIQGFANETARNAELSVIRATTDRDGGFFATAVPEGRELIIPNTVWGDPVISIGAGAFRNVGITHITISNSVTSIGSEAFWENQVSRRIITIGANVAMEGNPFRFSFQSQYGHGYVTHDDFLIVYNQNDKKAGTYIAYGGSRERAGVVQTFRQVWWYRPQ